MEIRHRRVTPVRIETDSKHSAHRVGLRYVSDDMPGFGRKRNGKQFRFIDVKGKPLTKPRQIKRIQALAIPPAWEDVWICPIENGHLQATGRDLRGRKQHRYHPRWRQVRDETKFNRMILFAKTLPLIRRKVRQDLHLPGLKRKKVLASIVRLLELSLIRVGNEEYARANKSFGLTTFQDKHANVKGKKVEFKFRGKSGKNHHVVLNDHQLAEVVKRCQELPGQDLFQYLDRHGRRQDVKSEDVNNYLREISGTDFTAKDFRTWAGTVLAAMALQEFKKFDSRAQARKNLVKAIERVAKRLGNTPTICKKCYVHPAIFDSYLDGSMVSLLKERAETRMKTSLAKLQPHEAAVLGLLQQRLAKENEPLANTLQRSLSKLEKNKRGRRSLH